MNLIRNNKLQSKLPSYILLSIILAFTIYALNILKGTKDTLIVSKLGAEMISTIKLFGVMPSSILFVLLYTKLANHLNKTQIYHLLNLLFNGFFMVFAFFLYTNATVIKPDLSSLISQFPFMKYQIIMLENWSYSLFYILAELWGNIMLSLMFWQILNQICTVNEAKKLYPKLSLFGESGLITAGLVAAFFTSASFSNSWDLSLQYICISVLVVSCANSVLLFILSLREEDINKDNSSKQSSSPTPNIYSSLKYVLASRHLRMIICILFCYGASINFIEGAWKGYLNVLFPSSLEYGHYTAQVQVLIGACSFCSLLLSSYIFSKIPWVISALFTPLTSLIAGTLFFITAIFSGELAFIFNTTYADIVTYVVIAGAAHAILTKAAKFAFFEPSKEIIFITLDDELKTKGKGVAEIAGERLGKSAGAAAQWFILSFSLGSTLLSIIPSLFILFFLVVILWIASILSLNQLVK